MKFSFVSGTFFPIPFRKRRTPAFWSILLFLSLLLIPEFAQASWWNPFTWGGEIENIGQSLITALVSIWITVIAFVPALLFFIISTAVTWLIEATLNIPLMPNEVGTPAFVTAGWNLTRGLANLFFVLILVFIGLATILRLQTYQFQKTFISFVAIVLLINFSGVLVGFIVDMGNIATVVFIGPIKAVGDTVFQNIFFIGSELVGETLSPKDFLSLTDQLIRGLVLGSVLAIFYTIASLVYLIIFLIFLLRAIILWILVITAPLAFAAYILPATKKFWNQWWGALIQWAFVGVPITFFLYLSLSIMNIGATDLFGGSVPSDPSDPTGNGEILNGMTKLFTALLAPLTGLVMLFIGVIISMTMAPRSAQVIGGLGTAAVGYAVVKAKLAGRRAGRSIVAGEKTGRLLENAATANTTFGKFGRTRVGKVVSKPFLWTQRGVAKQGLKKRAGLSSTIDEQMRDKDLQSFVSAKDWRGLAAQYNNAAITPEKKVAIATLLAQQEGQTGLNFLGEKNKQEAIGLAAERSPGKHLRDLIRDDPTIAYRKDVWSRRQIVDPDNTTDRLQMSDIQEELIADGRITNKNRSLDQIITAGIEDEDYEKIARKLSMRKSIRRLTPQRIAEMSREAFTSDTEESKEFLEEYVLNKPVQSWGTVQETFGEDAINNLRETALRLNKSGTLEKQNPSLIAASTSNSQLSHLLPTFISKHDVDGGDNDEDRKKYKGKPEDYVHEGSELVTRSQVKKYNEHVRDQRRRERNPDPAAAEIRDVEALDTLREKAEIEISALDEQETEQQGTIQGKSAQATQNRQEKTQAESEYRSMESDHRINLATNSRAQALSADMVRLDSEHTQIQQEIQNEQAELSRIQTNLHDVQQHLQEYENTDIPAAQQKVRVIKDRTADEQAERTRKAAAIKTPKPLPEFEGGILPDKVKDLLPKMGPNTPKNVRQLRQLGDKEFKALERETKELAKTYKKITVQENIIEDVVARTQANNDRINQLLAEQAAGRTLEPEEQDLLTALPNNNTHLATQNATAQTARGNLETLAHNFENAIQQKKDDVDIYRRALNAYQEQTKAIKEAKNAPKELKKKLREIDEEE